MFQFSIQITLNNIGNEIKKFIFNKKKAVNVTESGFSLL